MKSKIRTAIEHAIAIKADIAVIARGVLNGRDWVYACDSGQPPAVIKKQTLVFDENLSLAEAEEIKAYIQKRRQELGLDGVRLSASVQEGVIDTTTEAICQARKERIMKWHEDVIEAMWAKLIESFDKNPENVLPMEETAILLLDLEDEAAREVARLLGRDFTKAMSIVHGPRDGVAEIVRALVKQEAMIGTVDGWGSAGLPLVVISAECVLIYDRAGKVDASHLYFLNLPTWSGPPTTIAPGPRGKS